MCIEVWYNIKVLHNIGINDKNRGREVIFEPKTLSRYQGIKKKELTKTGFEPTRI